MRQGLRNFYLAEAGPKMKWLCAGYATGNFRPGFASWLLGRPYLEWDLTFPQHQKVLIDDLLQWSTKELGYAVGMRQGQCSSYLAQSHSKGKRLCAGYATGSFHPGRAIWHLDRPYLQSDLAII